MWKRCLRSPWILVKFGINTCIELIKLISTWQISDSVLKTQNLDSFYQTICFDLWKLFRNNRRTQQSKAFSEDINNSSDSCWSWSRLSAADHPSSVRQVVDPWRVGRQRPLDSRTSSSPNMVLVAWVCVGSCPGSSCHYMPVCGRGQRSGIWWWLMAATITQSNVPWPLLRQLTLWSNRIIRAGVSSLCVFRVVSGNNASNTLQPVKSCFMLSCLQPFHYNVITLASWRKM